jgi:iron complex transport system substrate-binding protein
VRFNALVVGLGVALATAALVLACGGPPETEERAAPSPLARPERIVSATLVADEILLDLIEPGRIVALSIFSDNPDYSNVAEKAGTVAERVTGNIEQVVGLDPDLVFVAGYSKPEFLALLRKSSREVFTCPLIESLAEALDNVEAVGAAVGEAEKARALADRAREKIAEVARRVEGRERPSVLSFSYGWVAGSGTVVDEAIEAAGGVNYATSQGVEGNQEVATEAILSWSPDYILVLGAENRRGGGPETLGRHPALAALPAVKEGRVLVMRQARLSTVSHYLADGIEDLARLLHPDCF